MENFSVLLIDDDESQLVYLSALISVISYPECEVFTALSAEEGIEIVEKNAVNLVITDYLMPGCDGHELLKKVKAINPNIDVIVLTANADTQEAVKTMKSGAYDYFIKPLRADVLENVLIHLLEKQNLIRENRILKQQFKDNFSSDTIISESEEIQSVLNTAFRSASSSATVLISGESGTGKELVARTIHQSSDRKDTPFVVVHIAALPETLIESELFGHRRGSFTGATEDRIGRFEQADRGTLFIDEIGEIPLSIQVKLLRVLQFGEIRENRRYPYHESRRQNSRREQPQSRRNGPSAQIPARPLLSLERHLDSDSAFEKTQGRYSETCPAFYRKVRFQEQ